MSEDLVAFLKARLDDDEQGVDFLHHLNCGAFRDEQSTGVFRDEDCDCGWPARVLADVAAKRAIVDRYGQARAGCAPGNGYLCAIADEYEDYTLCLLALPYADHPAYDESWRP